MLRGDKIVIFIICLVASLLFLWTTTFVSSASGRYISVQVKGKEIRKLEFENLKETKTFEVKTDKGVNVIAYDGEGAEIRSADCPDQICVKSGKISQPGEMIVCLPHELVVEIKSRSPGKDDLDHMLR